jgi:hypothetical protein
MKNEIKGITNSHLKHASYDSLEYWQEGTRINGSDFYQLLSINHHPRRNSDIVAWYQ